MYDTDVAYIIYITNLIHETKKKKKILSNTAVPFAFCWHHFEPVALRGGLLLWYA